MNISEVSRKEAESVMKLFLVKLKSRLKSSRDIRSRMKRSFESGRKQSDDSQRIQSAPDSINLRKCLLRNYSDHLT